MSDRAGEVASAIVVLFVMGGTMFAVYASVNGGNVSEIANLMTELAYPIVLLAIISFVVIAIFDALP